MKEQKGEVEQQVESFLGYMTNTLPGAIFDLAFGIGGDGRYGSSAEQAYGQTAAQNPDIHIHTSDVTMTAHTARQVEEAQIERARETEALYTQRMAEEQQTENTKAQDAAYYAALAEQREREQELGRNR